MNTRIASQLCLTLTILLNTIVLAQSQRSPKDVPFYAVLVVPQVITRSAPITISGCGFGTKANGYVSIGGQRAWTTTWTNTQVVAYVPESAPVGQNAVEVVTGGATIAAPIVAVKTRSDAQPTAQGRVAWRFEVLANYVSHRADVARDGTIYFNDSSGFLYALTPQGALKWIYDSQ